MAQLFEKNKIGGIELKNRLCMGPMGFGHTDADGAYSDRQIDYYTERAKGGYGLIYPTATKVSSRFEPSPFPNILQDAHHGTKLNMICERVHQYGAKVCSQLSLGLGRVGVPYLNTIPKSASRVPYFWDPSITCDEYTVDEIKYLIDEFGKSSLIAQNAGVDFIEMHAYGGYLIDQFISEEWNKRDDEYGGSRENRLRIVYEIKDAVRKYCGPDMPLIIKLTPMHGFEGGRTLEEGIEILKLLDNMGFAAFHLDYGTYECWYNAVTTVYQEEGNQLFIAEAVKKAGIKTPLIVQGKLGDPQLAQKVIEEGTAEIILHGHPSLTDPHWPNKVKRGREEDIRPCIGCNECIYVIMQNKHSTCAVNPLCGMEKDYALTPATEEGDVLIIGGGPGGLMAAITAAQRGFNVELWEKDSELGGALIAAGAPDFKVPVKRYVEYLRRQISKNKIDVHLNKKATVEDIIDRKPDTVILAAGSNPLVPKFEGFDKLNIVEATEMLKAGTCTGNKLVVLGGGLVGCEAAVHLDSKGKEVTVVELLEDILLTAKHSLNNDQALRKLIAESKVKLLTGTRLIQGEEGAVTIEKDGKKETVPCDTLVLALGYVSNKNMEEQLEGKIDRVITIGDNVKPGKIIDAVHQGYHTARLLEQL